MATANGAPHAVAQEVDRNLTPVDSSGIQRKQDLLDKLKEPFDPDAISWVVKATANGRRGKQGLVLPYADCRTYSGRLNDVVTTAGWMDEYSVQVVEGFDRKLRQKKEAAKPVAGAKVLVVCKLTIFGLGIHSGTGDAWADDENVLTSADAQAFKRACSDFGIGRYLYDIEGQWVDLDDRDRPVTSPLLPEWAIPKHRRTGSGSSSKSSGVRKETANKRDAIPEEQRIMSEIVSLATEIGNRLAVAAVSEVRGVALESQGKHNFLPMKDLLATSDRAELSAVLEKLKAIRRGVERTKAALAIIGLAEYKRLCSGINCPGGISDIPDTKTLAQLVQQLEDRARQMPKREPQEAASGSNPPRRDAKTSSGSKAGATLNDLRNKLLSLAQGRSSRERLRIGDVVSWASEGIFQFRDIGRLTDADMESLRKAVDRLESTP